MVEGIHGKKMEYRKEKREKKKGTAKDRFFCTLSYINPMRCVQAQTA